MDPRNSSAVPNFSASFFHRTLRIVRWATAIGCFFMGVVAVSHGQTGSEPQGAPPPQAPPPPQQTPNAPGRLGTETGFGLFQQYCVVCHGNANSAVKAPSPEI